MAQTEPVQVPPPPPAASAAGKDSSSVQQKLADVTTAALESTKQAVAQAQAKLDQAGVTQRVNETLAQGKQQAQAGLQTGTDYLYATADKVARASPEDVNQSSLARVGGGVLLLALSCTLVGLPLKIAIGLIALVALGAYLYQYRAPHNGGGHTPYPGSAGVGKGGAVGDLSSARGTGGSAIPGGGGAGNYQTGLGATGGPQTTAGGVLGGTAVGGPAVAAGLHHPTDKAHTLHDQAAAQAAQVATHRDPPPPLHPEGVPRAVDAVHHKAGEEAAQVAQQYLAKPEIKG